MHRSKLCEAGNLQLPSSLEVGLLQRESEKPLITVCQRVSLEFYISGVSPNLDLSLLFKHLAQLVKAVCQCVLVLEHTIRGPSAPNFPYNSKGYTMVLRCILGLCQGPLRHGGVRISSNQPHFSMISIGFLFWRLVVTRGIVQILFILSHTLFFSVDQDLVPILEPYGQCSFQSSTPLQGDPTLESDSTRVLHSDPCCWPVLHRSVRL